MRKTSATTAPLAQRTGAERWMGHALRLARRGYGTTSPNPLVGAVLVQGRKIIGQGWHQKAGEAHAEIEALRDAQKRGEKIRGATLYVTLEPCCTHGRTPPCTEAIIAAGIKRVIVGATDPNPQHSGRGLHLLRKAGIAVVTGVVAEKAGRLNEAFNHWIVHRTPFVTVKTAMTLDGKIATAAGESKWITGEKARACAMKIRQGADAILVGINTIIADDPSLTFRPQNPQRATEQGKKLRRIILDPSARIPLSVRVVSDEWAPWTTLVVSPSAPKKRVAALAQRVNILVAPPDNSNSQTSNPKLNLRWLLEKLGSENVTSLLVEGGGETNAQFLSQNLAQRVVFFYAPKILGGRAARKAVAGEGLSQNIKPTLLRDLEWKRLGADLLLTARVG